jgi:hypothetical protein
MTRRWLRILSMAALAPLAVDVPGEGRDSASTSFMVAVGGGSYAAVTRGCDNSVISARQRHFDDMGFAVQHDMRGPFQVGVRGTVLNRMPAYGDHALLLNPNVSFESHYVGIGAGFVTGTRDEDDLDLWPVSGHLRLGSKRGPFHFSIHALEDVPLVSGGGAVRLGFGFRPGRDVDAWVGMSTPDPYDKAGLILKGDFHATRDLTLHLTGRLGSSESIDENAAAIGISYRFPHGGGAAPPPDSSR